MIVITCSSHFRLIVNTQLSNMCHSIESHKLNKNLFFICSIPTIVYAYGQPKEENNRRET